MSLLGLISQSGFIAKIVLLVLIACSVLSWAVIFMKYKVLKSAVKQSTEFLNVFWYGQSLDEIYGKSEKFKQAPLANVFKAGFKELKKISELDSKVQKEGIGNIARALSRTSTTEIGLLEKRVSILATIGSATPFVGLFGTVWGIMNSFQGIGTTGSANLAVVAPGIAEALIATAAGLGAAIPAIVAYNYFATRIKSVAIEMDTFSQDFLNIVQRSFLKT